MSFDKIWGNIACCAGQEFRTKTGITFTYTVSGGFVIPDHTQYPLAKKQFQIAADVPNLTGPAQIHHVRGPSYVFAILTDPRIQPLEK